MRSGPACADHPSHGLADTRPHCPHPLPSPSYLLSAAVLFNLFAAVATSPGKPHECCRGLPPHTACSRGGSGAHGSSSSSASASSMSRRWWLFGRGGAAASAASPAAAAAAPPLVVPQYAYSHLRYCWSCRGPQPAEAQHCHVCGCCVVDLDHHCPFIANCVGRWEGGRWRVGGVGRRVVEGGGGGVGWGGGGGGGGLHFE
mgnify:CR=1 FL=1